MEAPKMPERLYLNRYLLRPGMLYKAQDPPAPETEYIRSDLAELTADDIKFIIDKYSELPIQYSPRLFEEILKQFNEQKGK